MTWSFAPTLNVIQIVPYTNVLEKKTIYAICGHKLCFFYNDSNMFWIFVGAVQKMRRTLEGVRGHPYGRVSLS